MSPTVPLRQIAFTSPVRSYGRSAANHHLLRPELGAHQEALPVRISLATMRFWAFACLFFFLASIAVGAQEDGDTRICRCPAYWEKFYRKRRFLARLYPFDYVFTEQLGPYYVIDGLVVLRRSDEKCDNGSNNNGGSSLDSVFFRGVRIGGRKLRSAAATENSEEEHRKLAVAGNRNVDVFPCPSAVNNLAPSRAPAGPNPSPTTPSTPAPSKPPTPPTTPAPA